ncbi:uncharacterized protein [Montipora foliosa]|uniref:uncharacterized protein n=1 Tax=Montipora foliosa TaxID=591990 RepID=UPI0035F1CA9F
MYTHTRKKKKTSMMQLSNFVSPINRLEIDGKNILEEPKTIIFLSKLVLLFQFCHLCFAPKPNLKLSQSGTFISVTAKCEKCCRTFSWESQPKLLAKFPAGNLLLSFAVLCAEASIKKILVVFKHMNLLVYHGSCYYYHQRHLLIPAIVTFWRSYRDRIINSLAGREVDLAGDGRHDSMGHSAKFCTYSIFCCTVGLIIDVALVQCNEAGSSSGMEFLGHQRAFAYLFTTAMKIKSFISDRHRSIAKWMRETCSKKCRELNKPVVEHFFDLWHVAKQIQKTLTKLSKEKTCEIIGRWKKACLRHFYWSVTSTEELQGEVKLAKFEAFLSHVINKQQDLPNRLFTKCHHGPITKEKVWMTKCSDAYGKLVDELNKPSLTKAIKKTSSNGQTSSLEGYHSVINQFAPKMLAYSYLGMLSRCLLAALHFNYNLNRQAKTNANGEATLRVNYPKQKYGEATVKEGKSQQNYDYVTDIYRVLVNTPRIQLKQTVEELQAIVPEPVCSTWNKQSKADAITKYKERKAKETTLVAPTFTEQEMPQCRQQENARGRRKRKAPTCSKCGAPRKGHKRDMCQS